MSGLLAGIYSAGDRMKRKLGGLLSNPLENIALGSTRMAEDVNALSALASEAGYMPNTVNRSDQSVLVSPQQKALARALLADKATEIGMAGTFIGPSAKTWNAAKAAQAQKALDAGVPPEQVWAQTGTFRGADGKLRQEISDHAAKARDYQLTPKAAYWNASREASDDTTGILRGAVDQMKPYVGMSKNQLVEEYRKTGGAIVEAATSGNIELAKQMQRQRYGLEKLLENMGNATYGPTSAFLKHGELGQAYPDIYKLHTRIAPYGLGDAKGQYIAGNKQIGEQIGLKAKPVFSDAKSTQLHELQHAIQQREGWAKGGSPDAIAQEYGAARSRLHFLEREPEAIQANKAVDALWNDVFKTGKLTEQQALAKEAELLKRFPVLAEQRQLMDALRNTSEDGFGAYKRLAGEAEARLTQSRMNMNPMQRAASYPPSMFDVPIEQQIVRFK